MERTTTPDLADRMDVPWVPWDLRDVPLDRLGDSAEARQLVSGLLARVAAPAHELVVGGFNNTI